MVRDTQKLLVEDLGKAIPKISLSQALGEVCGLCGLDLGRVWYVDKPTLVLQRGECWLNDAARCGDAYQYKRPLTLPFGEGVPGRAWEDKVPVWIDDASYESTYSYPFPAYECGVFAVPVLFQDSVIGVLEFAGWVLKKPHEDLLKHILELSHQMKRLIVKEWAQRWDGLEQYGNIQQDVENGLAHDLNNVLTAIAGFVDLSILKLPSSDPVCSYLHHIRTVASRGREMVKQIMSVPSVPMEERKPFDLGEILHEVLGIFRETAGEEIEITENFPVHNLRIHGNPDEIYRVVMNLCWNAVQSMEKGGKIFVGLEEIVLGSCENSRNVCLSEGRWAHVIVEDSGVGIPQENRERIFDPFFTTKGAQGGTGLGLANVQQIITGHGGVISVESTPGQGSSFHLYLPLP